MKKLIPMYCTLAARREQMAAVIAKKQHKTKGMEIAIKNR